VFKDTLAAWKAGDDTSYGVNIEELGFDLNDCEILASSAPVDIECWNCKGTVEVVEGTPKTKCPHCGKDMYINW
jgi:Zn finger protein HypA/HybF involved in hydrogenase expression